MVDAAKRGRGRPKGSKNRPKVQVMAAPVQVSEGQRRRGRPPGSKNRGGAVWTPADIQASA